MLVLRVEDCCECWADLDGSQRSATLDESLSGLAGSGSYLEDSWVVWEPLEQVVKEVGWIAGTDVLVEARDLVEGQPHVACRPTRHGPNRRSINRPSGSIVAPSNPRVWTPIGWSGPIHLTWPRAGPRSHRLVRYHPAIGGAMGGEP